MGSDYYLLPAYPDFIKGAGKEVSGSRQSAVSDGILNDLILVGDGG